MVAEKGCGEVVSEEGGGGVVTEDEVVSVDGGGDVVAVGGGEEGKDCEAKYLFLKTSRSITPIDALQSAQSGSKFSSTHFPPFEAEILWPQ